MPGCTNIHGLHVNNKPITSMTHVASESKLGSVLRSSMHLCLGTWVAIRRAVVFLRKLPMHLVQELNAGIVASTSFVAKSNAW